MSSRRQFLLQGCAGLAAWSLARFAYGADRPPNIVLILADDLGYGDPACLHPDSRIPTPHLDALARGGRRFNDAHTPSAVCTPTRYGLLTGRYAWRTRLKSGVLWGYSPPLLEPGRLTLPGLLKDAGYHTACIGKWHLGLGWQTTDGSKLDDSDTLDGQNVAFDRPLTWSPQDSGFDYFFGIAASLDMPPYVYIENNRCTAVPTGVRDITFRPGLAAPGFEAVDVQPELARRACAYLEERARTPDRPFFLYFPLTAPHTPVVPVAEVKGKSEAGAYGDFVVQVDQTVGKVVETLRAQGLLEDTLLIVTSDNGSTESVASLEEYGHLANGHWRGRKSDAWEGGHRVPFIAHWPARVPAGTESDETICLTDLLRTCAALTGRTLPRDAGEDSYNVLPALLGESHDRPIRDFTIAHSIEGAFAIRQGPWKLVDAPGSGGWSSHGKSAPAPDAPPVQLYRLDTDPGETNNLWREHPEKVRELKTLLQRCKEDGRSPVT